MNNPAAASSDKLPDTSVESEQWLDAQPKLRSDLRFYPQKSNDKLIVVVEDPIRNKFFRIGKAEYLFVSQLDGNQSVREAYEISLEKAQKSGLDFGLDLERSKEICDFLSRSNLIVIQCEAALQTLAETHERSQLISFLNPIFQRFRLFDPSRWLAKHPAIHRRIFSFAGLLVWLAVIGLAAVLINENLTEFWAASSGILSGYGWITMIVTWILLKIVHEFGHASCCHRFGGTAPETGIALICFFPVAYVNVSSSWKFASKWKRMAVAVAGIYVELFVAALAAIAWCYVEDPVTKGILYDIVLVASITTLLFNINPLMKFDGYYVLADFVEMPTLYQRSQAAVTQFFKTLFFGRGADQQQRPPELKLVTLYGFAVLLWRIVICVGLFLTVSLMGEGFGIIFAALALVFWIAPAVVKFAKFVQRHQVDRGLNWLRFSTLSLAVLLAFSGVTKALLLPQQIVATGIVEFRDHQIVRPKSSGFVHEIFVQPNQQVTSGMALIKLANPELMNQLRQLELEEQRLNLEIEKFRADGQTSQVIAENQMLKKTRAELKYKRDLVDSLMIRATVDGKVQIRELQTLRGRYVQPGDELMVIANQNQKQILASISQHQFDGIQQTSTAREITNQVADSGRFYVPETGLNFAPLTTFSPKATLTPVSPLLCANVGGPLAVKAKESHPDQPSTEKYELLEPHFVVKFALNERQSRELECGRRVRLTLTGSSTSLGYQIYKSTRRWLNAKYQAALMASEN